MELLNLSEKIGFNQEIKVGSTIWAKANYFNEGIPGIISAITDDKICVQYHPKISNVVNHYIIPATEVAEGIWEIRISEDLVNILEYPTKEVENETGTVDQEIATE